MMDGFFSLKEIEEASESMQPEGPQCDNCGLFKHVRSPKMPVFGQGREKIMIVGEAPGQQEDAMNRQFVGTVGEHLRITLQSLGVNMAEDCWLLNAVNCRPTSPGGTNREPSSNEINCCRPYVLDMIETHKPHVLLLLGGNACESLFGNFYSDCSITRWRGLTIPDAELQCWMCPTFHPSYLVRQSKDDNLKALWMLDLKRALSCVSQPLYKPFSPTDFSHIVTDYAQIVEKLLGLISDPPTHLSFDYETTGKKPYFPGMKIVSIAYCAYPTKEGGASTYSFPLHYRNMFSSEQTDELEHLWAQVMKGPSKKIAHNFSFENSWTGNKFPVDEVTNRYWCTQVAAHIMDDRRKFTRLKFQTYAMFGHLPYDNHIKPFLEGAGNTPNNVERIPLGELLEYNAYDAFYTMLLFLKQKGHFEQQGIKDHPNLSLFHAREFFMRGGNALMDMTESGVRADASYYENSQAELTNEIRKLKSELAESHEAVLFQHTYNRVLDPNSNTDLQRLFFELLRLPPIRATKTGYSVDEASLEKLNHEFAHKLLRMRKIEKIHGTYMKQFVRETCNGKIHTSFNLFKARSMRSSSSSPNLQNVPTRMEEAKKYTRSGVFPSIGNQFLFADFKGIEVCVAAMYSKDPNLVYYICTPGTDMHRDQSCDIWMLPVEEVEKKIRFYTKNGFVFPEFYGDWYGACAEALWYNCIEGDLKLVSGAPLRQHMASKGIRSLDTFKEHMKGVEDRFWKKFGKLKQWQMDMAEFYRANGYVVTKHGFRRGGHLKNNQIGNTPIQAEAFHLLLYTLMNTHESMKREGCKSKLVLQIHDEMVCDLYPPEYHFVRDTMTFYGTQKIREDHDWINVPLELEFEACPVNGSWYEKQEIDEDGVNKKSGKQIIGEIG
jgi:uracil-DNA glycosylase family 4